MPCIDRFRQPVDDLRLALAKTIFRYRLETDTGGDGKRQGVTGLPIDTFMGRWLDHVPPRGFQTVRGYGLYCGNQHSRLDEARQALDAEPSAVEQPTPDLWQQWCESAGMVDVCRCPQCGQSLVSHHKFASGRSPPAGAFEFRRSRQSA